jgi:hypothetical protein
MHVGVGLVLSATPQQPAPIYLVDELVGDRVRMKEADHQLFLL